MCVCACGGGGGRLFDGLYNRERNKICTVHCSVCVCLSRRTRGGGVSRYFQCQVVLQHRGREREKEKKDIQINASERRWWGSRGNGIIEK